MHAVDADRTDLLDAEHTQSPYAYLGRLRETEPVHWNARHKAWLVTDYEQVSKGLRDPRLASNRLRHARESIERDGARASIGRTLGILEKWMVFQDGPEHRRLRGVVQQAFTRQAISALEGDVRALVRQQVAELARRTEQDPSRPVDLLNEIAYEIPGPIICKMLGVPQADRPRFIEWTEHISTLIGGFTDDGDRYEKAHAAVCALEDYLTGIIENTSPVEENLMRRLIVAESEGQRLSRDEVIATGILLLFGGNRTTSCMIANGVRALMLHPDQAALLRADPALIAPAVEEIMRWEPHTKFTVRIAAEDFEWCGQPIRAGQRVFLSPLSANRDPKAFDSPDTFDVRRPNAIRHLGFGTGPHLCLGNPLARLELRIMYAEILDLLPKLRLVEPDGVWMPTLINRVQQRLRVRAAA
jgi:cytochrome P450